MMLIKFTQNSPATSYYMTQKPICGKLFIDFKHHISISTLDFSQVSISGLGFQDMLK